MDDLVYYVLLMTACCLPARGVADPGPDETRESRGRLADGTEYLVRRPAHWNGVVICDLDLLPSRHDGPFYLHLTREGYGLAGTARRHPSYPLEDNLRRVREALAAFRAEYGDPDRVIVYGRSRGGNVAASAAELAPGEFDAAVAISAVPHALTFNQAFDLFFLLKALLAPGEPGLEYYGLAGSGQATEPLRTIQDRWSDLFRAARATPEGAARVALAFALAQYAGYGGASTNREGVPKPDFSDPPAVATAMFELLQTTLIRRLNVMDRSHEQHGRYIGNEGVDYAWYVDHADPRHMQVVRALYRDAALEIADDLKRINQEPRVAIDPEDAAAKLEHPGRTQRGAPRIPILRVDTIADSGNPTAPNAAYADYVRWNGHEDYYRSAMVGRGGHAHCTVAEKVAAIRVVEQRLDSGAWPATDAGNLNALAAALGLGPSMFVEEDPRRYSGQWRLHAWSHAFDLSFEDIVRRLKALETEERITPMAFVRLAALLRRAAARYGQGQWEAAGKALDDFLALASQVEAIPDERARNDLVWDARLMRLQVARRIQKLTSEVPEDCSGSDRNGTYLSPISKR